MLILIRVRSGNYGQLRGTSDSQDFNFETKRENINLFSLMNRRMTDEYNDVAEILPVLK